VGITFGYFTKNYAFRSNGDGNFTASGYQSTCNLPLDFNGDGRTDCLVPGSDGTAASNALNAAVGGGSYSKAAGFNLTAVGNELGVAGGQPVTIGAIPVDINGDGRSDLIRWEDTPANNALYLSNGDGTFRQSTTFGFTGIQLKKSDYTSDFLVGD